MDASDLSCGLRLSELGITIGRCGRAQGNLSYACPSIKSPQEWSSLCLQAHPARFAGRPTSSQRLVSSS